MSNKNSSNKIQFGIIVFLFLVVAVSLILGIIKINRIEDSITKVEMMTQKDSIFINLDSIPNMSENDLRTEIYSAAHEASESFVNHTGNLLQIFGIMLTIITAIICIIFPFLINKEQKELIENELQTQVVLMDKKSEIQKDWVNDVLQSQVVLMDKKSEIQKDWVTTEIKKHKEWIEQRLKTSEQALEEQKKTIETIETNLGNEIIREKEQREKYHYLLKSTNRFTNNMRRSILNTAKDILPLVKYYKEYNELENVSENEKINVLCEMIDKGQANSEIYYKLGKLYSKNPDNYNKACVAFQNAVNHNNEFVDAYKEWADILKMNDDLIGSWEKREKAIYHIMDKDKSQELQSEQNEIEKKLFTTPSDLQSNKTIIVEKVPFNMILVKGGTFKMGEEPKQGKQDYHNHKVLLNDYYIGETVVTQKQWCTIFGSNPSKNKGDNLPVENISWENAMEFIKLLNSYDEIKNKGITFRLPTNAEWEYAARGGYKQDAYHYSGNDSIGEVAWYGENSMLMTHPVKEKKPNGLGIYDMSGNVYEWCQDYWWGYDYHDDDDWVNPCYDKEKDDYGLGRICRGGGWGSSEQSCRVTNVVNGHKSGAIGFRLVCTLTKSTL